MAGVHTNPDPWPYCPDCGAKMVLRTNRRTKERFWGCSDFPDCRGSRDVGPDGKPLYDDRLPDPRDDPFSEDRFGFV